MSKMLTEELTTEAEDSRLPAYRRIENDLRTRITQGEWTIGEMLPSRRWMAKKYGVDLNTFQRAILPLIKEGILRADEGRGTFLERTAHNGTSNETVKPEKPAALSTADERVSIAGKFLGIIAGYSPEDARMPALITAMESTFSSYGGQSRLFNLLRPNLPPTSQVWIPTRDAVNHLLREPVDAIALIAVYDMPGMLEEAETALGRTRIPLLYVSWEDAQHALNHVYYDNKIAGYQAAKHLINCGYKEFTFFAPFTATWVEERIAFARSALKDAGIPESNLTVYPSEQSVYQFGDHATEGYQAALAGFRRHGSTPAFSEAIIAANDRLAQGLLRAASECGRNAGRDFSVIGFDDDLYSREMGLTTLRPPLEALGREGGRLIKRALEGETEPIQIRLQPQLVLRSSTRPIRKHY